MIGRKKDCSVIIMLPPLSRIAKNVSSTCYCLSFTDFISKPSNGLAKSHADFETEEFREGPMGATIREQKVHFILQFHLFCSYFTI